MRDEQFPAERLVQAIWQHQRLRRDELKTLDGKNVRVFHPGFVNFEGGPDFRGAVLQIGSDAPCCGDVEVDLRVGGWRAHGHAAIRTFKASCFMLFGRMQEFLLHRVKMVQGRASPWSCP